MAAAFASIGRWSPAEAPSQSRSARAVSSSKWASNSPRSESSRRCTSSESGKRAFARASGRSLFPTLSGVSLLGSHPGGSPSSTEPYHPRTIPSSGHSNAKSMPGFWWVREVASQLSQFPIGEMPKSPEDVLVLGTDHVSTEAVSLLLFLRVPTVLSRSPMSRHSYSRASIRKLSGSK